MKMRTLLCALLVLSNCCTFAQTKPSNSNTKLSKEYHVSVNGNDANDGSARRPLKTIMAAAKWLTEQPRKLVTTQTLRPAIVPDLPFENTDGSPLKIDTDYLGNKRNTGNPSPGAFEIKNSGKQKIKVW